MAIRRSLFRILAPLSLFVLAACQTTPDSQTDAAVSEPATAPQTAQQPAEPMPEQAQSVGAPVAVFLADMDPREGWQAVQLDVGAMYLNPQPVLIRDDFTGVQAGASQEGDGLLALELSPEAQQHITQVTTANPNLRLALIVGQTLLAAPGYSEPVTTPHLVFVVGTENNALAVARAIAGVPADGSGDHTGQPGAQPAGTGGPANSGAVAQ